MRNHIKSIFIGLALLSGMALLALWYIHLLRLAILALPVVNMTGTGTHSEAHWSIHLPWPQSGYWFVVVLCAFGLVYEVGVISYCSWKHIGHEARGRVVIGMLALLIVLTAALMHLSKP